MSVAEYSTACPDWERRIMAGEPLITFPPLFPAEAARGLSIFKELHLKDVPGCPTYGQVGRKWQFDFVSSIFGSCDPETGRRLIREFFLCVAKKNDKALALDTPIPNPTGWTTMGDIAPGDVVFGANGKPCNVLSVSDIFTDHSCYKVSFSNGESVVADSGHLWKTNALADKLGYGQGNHGHSQRERIRTTKEIAATLFRNDGARNHSMLMPQPIELPEAQLPIPPYTLGAWLGDGSCRDARITCADEEIMENIAKDGFSFGKRTIKKESKAWTQTIGTTDKKTCIRGHAPAQTRMRYDSKRGKYYPACYACDREVDHFRRNGTPLSPITRFSFSGVLRGQGLLGNKHIPEQYFRASIEQRLSLLQGLMDTDGSINKNGRVLMYSGTNIDLVNGVSALLSTLGVKNTVIERKVTCNGKPSGVAYFVQFMAFRDELPVFRLKRKLDRMRLRSERKNARSKTVQIVAAEKTAIVPVKCIKVDSSDSQFLFGRTMLPTHNSGSAAGIMMTALLLNWREAAEFIIIAPTMEVANNSFFPARNMIKSDPELADLLKPQDHIRQITHMTTGATLKVVAADSDTVSGIKGTGVLIEELWAFGKKPQSANMLIEATGGLAARPEGFVIYLTTHADEAPAGVFKDKLTYAREVRDGKIENNQFLPILYENPEFILKEKKYLDKKYFYITNPNLGASVDEDFIIQKLKQAQDTSEEEVQKFIAKHLNVEMGLSLKSQRWAGADFWEAAAGEVTLDLIIEKSDVIEIGIDGGGLDDLLGLAVLGRIPGGRKMSREEAIQFIKDEKEDEFEGYNESEIDLSEEAIQSAIGENDLSTWLLWTHAWAHSIALDRRKSEAPKYHDFSKDRDLSIVKQIGKDIKQVGDIVRKCESSGLLDRVGVDPSGIGAVVDELEAGDKQGNLKIEHERIVGISQGWRLNSAIKTMERKVAAKEIVHAGRPMMAWCVGNARVEPKGNAILITKQASGTGKIDPLMAALSCVALMALNPEAKNGKSQYENLTLDQIRELRRF